MINIPYHRTFKSKTKVYANVLNVCICGFMLYVRVNVCICLHVHMYVFKRVYVCVYDCICIHVCSCMCILSSVCSRVSFYTVVNN